MGRRILVGAGTAAGIYAASEAAGLPTLVGLAAAAVIFLMFALTKNSVHDG